MAASTTLGSSTGTPTTPPNGGIDPNSLLSAVQSKLLSQSSVVSSSDSDLQNSLNQAMSGVQTSQDKTDQATTLNYNQKEQDAQDKGSQDVLAGRAAGSGGVLNIGALRAVTDTIDKNVNDLEKQKQELILQNDAAGASKIADMQLQALQFKQTAQQQTFSQLLQLGQFGVQAQTEQRAQTAADDAHSEAVGKLIQDNPEAGILAGDTLDQAYAKIGHAPDSPALQLQKAQISKIYSDIAHAGDKTMTDAQTKTSGLNAFGSTFVPGQKLSDGTPVLDTNGFLTTGALKQAMKAAPTKKITSDDLLNEYSYLLAPAFDKKGNPVPGTISKSYGLSAKQLHDLNATAA